MNKLLNQVNKSVEKGNVQDQTEEKGGFEREIIPEGKYPARFVGWIEIGDRDGGEWKGKKKPNVRKAYALFELLSKKLAQEIEVDGVKKTIYPVHREMIDVKSGEKANLTKLFKKMAAGRSELTHIAQMLSEPFLVKIVHVEKGEGDNKRIYENARTKEEGWLISPPYREVEDDDGDLVQKKVKVKEQTVDLQLLLWDDPTPEQWESIKGRTYTYKEGENEKEFEGGYYQYTCCTQALDFAGSPLEAMLAGGELPLDDVLDDEEDLSDDADDVLGDEEEDKKQDSAGEDDLGLDDLDDIDD